jgi:uncharacterized membrane protein YfcA
MPLNMTPSILVLAVLFAVVAALYASVGLGGGTGYLALMTLFGVPREIMPSTALTLNIVVTGAAMLRFGLAGRLQWRVLLPFVLPAIPAAFVGGWIYVDRRAFLALLAIGLAAAALAMLHSAQRPDEVREPSVLSLWLVGVPVGVAIGLASGLLGIGGGVFLGPVVLLLGWAGSRETAAMCSACILTVSIAGLAAHGVRGTFEPSVLAVLAVAGLIGGLVGAHVAETRLSEATLKRIFAVVIVIAAVKAGLGAAGFG